MGALGSLFWIDCIFFLGALILSLLEARRAGRTVAATPNGLGATQSCERGDKLDRASGAKAPPSVRYGLSGPGAPGRSFGEYPLIADSRYKSSQSFWPSEFFRV